MAKLIDATYLILSSNIENNRIHVKDIVDSPEIDPVHFAGGCYCKECKYHDDEVYPGSEWELNEHQECWCNWWDNVMPLNGFCSEGRKDDMKNA